MTLRGNSFPAKDRPRQAKSAARYRNPFLCGKRRPPRWRLLLLIGLLLPLACSRRLPLIEEDTPLLEERPRLARDLLAASRDLDGSPEENLARLDLVEDRSAPVKPFAGGFLVLLRRGRRELLVWLGAGEQRGTSLLLCAGDSLKLLDRLESGAEGPQGRHRLLLWERRKEEGAALKQLCRRDLQGGVKILARAPVHRLRLESSGGAVLEAASEPAPCFVEGPDSWRMERRRAIRRTGQGWSLSAHEPLESPYRTLSSFLEAARRGRWKQAARHADLPQLLALPDGGWSRRLAATMKLSLPRLLDRRLALEAPPRGSLLRIEDLSGRRAWGVAFRFAEAEELRHRGESRANRGRWLLTRLERVED